MISKDKKRVSITLTPERIRQLEELSRALGITKSDVISILVSKAATNQIIII